MKKFVFAITVLLIACFAFAAESYVNIKYLATQPGVSVYYDWELNQVTVKGKSGSVKLVVDYPYVTTGTKSVRLDIPPFVENGQLFISQATSDRIMLLTGETQAPPTPVPVKVTQSRPEPAPVPTKVAVVKPAPTAVPTKEVVQETASAEPTKETVRVEQPKKNNARKLVIIDPGHGDQDPGATGPTGLQEKMVVLMVANKVKEYLGDYPADVLVTRTTDKFITLKNRAYFANERKADLFVSIHCNSSESSSVSGTRAYIYGRVASSKEAAEAAKYENKEVGVFEFLLNDLRKGAYENLSIEAAGNIQQTLVKELKLKWEPTERAPFYVLANTNMPSVLVEIAFISNPKEEEKMKTYEFKDRVAYGISRGIEQYLDKIK